MIAMGTVASWSAVANALPDPIAWWTFNDGANPTFEEIHGLTSTLASNNGTTGPTFVDQSALPDVDCNRSALSFDGADDYVSVPVAGAATAYDGLAQLTLSAWVRPDNTAGGTLVSKYDTHGGWVSWYLGLNQNNVVRVLIGGAGGQSRTYEVYIGADGGSAPAQEWTHVAAVWTGGNTPSSLAIYINGTSVATTPTSSLTFTGMYAGSVPIEIGSVYSVSGSQVGRSGFYRGQIDDVRVYDVALSAEDVATLAAGGGSIDACDQCPIVCQPEPSERVFYGVVRRASDGTLGSVQCWTAAGTVECRRDVSGDLLVGPPMCGQ